MTSSVTSASRRQVRTRIPLGLRLLRRAPQRRQVDADQRAGRHQGRHHQQPAADHPARAIRGIVHRPDAQLILVDTPGLHRPRTLLGERLNDLVRATLTEVDVVGFCVPADEPVGPGDRFIAGELAGLASAPRWSRSSPRPTGRQPRPDRPSSCSRSPASASGPTSCRSPRWPASRSTCWPTCWSRGCPRARRSIRTASSPTSPSRCMVAELIREAALEGVRDELPHSIAVVVEEMAPRRAGDDLIDVHAQHLRRAAQPEGHRHRRQGRPAQGRRHPGPAGRSRRCSARRSTSTCTSRSPRTGSATPSSCAAWASTTDPP